MTPGAKSQPLDDIRCVAWNRKDSLSSFHCLTNSKQFSTLSLLILFCFYSRQTAAYFLAFSVVSFGGERRVLDGGEKEGVRILVKNGQWVIFIVGMELLVTCARCLFLF
jgi:hypothetical protein